MFKKLLCQLMVLSIAAVCLPAVAAETVDVRFATEAGIIEVELYPARAPLTVANFLRYVDGGHYADAGFYRVVRLDNQPNSPVKIEVIQGGRGVAAYDTARPPLFAPIAHETTVMTGLRHVDGALSMARLAPGSATSEFFICINDQPSLDFAGKRNPDGQGFAVFGQVTRGMDVVRRIQAGRSDATVPDYLEGIAGQRLHDPVMLEKIDRLLR